MLVPFRKSLPYLFGVSFTSLLTAGTNEEATLEVTLYPGVLEIVPASVNGPYMPTSGAVSVSSSEQIDAVTYEISNITINDLNGDGLGWKLTASPGNLSNGNESVLPVGKVVGFSSPTDPHYSAIKNPNELHYISGTGVSNFTIDYKLSYTVPAHAAAGTYSGIIVFKIIAL